MPSIRLGEYHFLTTWTRLGVGVIGVGFLVSLGFWQLHRGEEKKQMMTRFLQEAKQPPATWDGHSTLISYQRVRLKGTYQLPVFLLDNQFFRHQWGYHVLSPFHLEKGERIVMVDRGWIKGDEIGHTLPKVSTPSGEQLIVGYVYYPQKNHWIKQPTLVDSSRTSIVIEQFLPNIFLRVLHCSVLPFIIRLDQISPHGLQRDWQIVSMPPARHIAYAIQWFALAVLFCGIFVGVQMKRVKRVN